MTRFADMKIGSRLILLEVIFLLGFGLFGLFTFISLNRVKVNGSIYAHIERNADLIADIFPPALYVVESYLNALQMMEAADEGAGAEGLAGLVAQGRQLRHDYEKRRAFWIRELPEGELKRMLVTSSYDTALAFYEARDQEFIPALLSGDLEKAKRVNRAVLQPKYLAHRAIIVQVVVLASRETAQVKKAAAHSTERTVILLLVIGFATAAITLLFAIFLTRSITVPLRCLAGVARGITEGNLDTAPLARIISANETGTLAQAFHGMTAQLSDFIEKFRASEAKYRIVADNTHDWEFWRSPDGRFLYVSPSCERISGYKPVEFEQDPTLILRLVHPDDRAAFEAHLCEALRGESARVFEMEFRLIAADGAQRWISHLCSSVFDEAGRFLGKRGTNRDITKRKKSEAELVEAKEQAEAANKVKAAFISSMSHELRTPLNAILGYTQILIRDENLSETQRNQLEVLRSSGQYLLALINDILDMGKIVTGEIELEEKAFELSSLLRQVYSITRIKAEAKGLEFGYEPATPVPLLVRGDEGKLRQILLNLLDNAVRYTRRGGVTLRASYQADDTGIFRCEVVDTGIGIESDNLTVIFEPFVQLARNGQAREGTGLGLTIARHLVALMHGKLEVESTSGAGSLFRVELPLPAVRSGEPAAATPLQDVATSHTPGADQEEYFDVPPQEKLRELYGLAQLGDMRKIRAWAEDVLATDARYRRFATEVRDLAGGFKAKAITALVEKYLQEKDND